MKPRVGTRLGLELLRAVLAEQGEPGFLERRHLLQRHVLDRRQDVHAVADLGADSLEVVADAGGVEPGDQARHTTPDWRPVMPRSRRWEKSVRGSLQIVQSPVSWTSMPCASSCSRATTPMSRWLPRR